MKDRIPANPGRVLVTPENGGAAYYATLTRADNPTQAGDPLNKNTFLKDATAALFGLDADSVPDDVLAAIWSLIDKNATDIAAGVKIEIGTYTGTGTFGSAHPNTLTFGISPYFLAVQHKGGGAPIGTDTDGGDSGIVAMRGQTSVYTNVPDNTNYTGYVSFTWGDKTVSWYGSGGSYTAVDYAQLNVSGWTYIYIAIGY